MGLAEGGLLAFQLGADSFPGVPTVPGALTGSIF